MVAKAIVEGILDKSIVEETKTPRTGYYRVLAGSYKDKENAIKRQMELINKGFQASIVYYE